MYVFSALRDDGWFTSFKIFGASVFGALNGLERCLGPRVGDLSAWLRGSDSDYSVVKQLGEWERNHIDRDTTLATV